MQEPHKGIYYNTGIYIKIHNKQILQLTHLPANFGHDFHCHDDIKEKTKLYICLNIEIQSGNYIAKQENAYHQKLRTK